MHGVKEQQQQNRKIGFGCEIYYKTKHATSHGDILHLSLDKCLCGWALVGSRKRERNNIRWKSEKYQRSAFHDSACRFICFMIQHKVIFYRNIFVVFFSICRITKNYSRISCSFRRLMMVTLYADYFALPVFFFWLSDNSIKTCFMNLNMNLEQGKRARSAHIALYDEVHGLKVWVWNTASLASISTVGRCEMFDPIPSQQTTALAEACKKSESEPHLARHCAVQDPLFFSQFFRGVGSTF